MFNILVMNHHNSALIFRRLFTSFLLTIIRPQIPRYSDLLYCLLPAHLDAMLRSLVIGRLGKAGHKATVEEAKRRFAAHCDGSGTLPADLRNPVCVRRHDAPIKIIVLIIKEA